MNYDQTMFEMFTIFNSSKNLIIFIKELKEDDLKICQEDLDDFDQEDQLNIFLDFATVHKFVKELEKS